MQRLISCMTIWGVGDLSNGWVRLGRGYKGVGVGLSVGVYL